MKREGKERQGGEGMEGKGREGGREGNRGKGLARPPFRTFRRLQWRIQGGQSGHSPPSSLAICCGPLAKTRKRNDMSGVLENTVNFHINVYTFTNVMVQTSIQQRFSAVLTFAFMIL
jgi:hypothetical protein